MCFASLGPAEDPRGCLTCRGTRLFTNQDRIVAVLERAKDPLAYWDIKRLLDSNGRRPVNKGSVLVWLASDPRTCWGGPGIYGMYRHELLPGVRDLGEAIAVFIHAAHAAVSQEVARFMLQRIGYRFLSTSIYLALRRVENDGLLRRQDRLWVATKQSIRPILRLSRPADIDLALERAAAQATSALDQWGTAVRPTARWRTIVDAEELSGSR
jgi:hypothetical protein